MLKFTLPIVPTPQARPRVAVRGKFAQAYKTKDQQANERTLEACLMQHKPPSPMAGPLVLEFVAALPVPKSVSKKARASMLSGEDYPAKRPDIDNLCKQLCDSMTRLQFWHDDVQVVCLRADKIYAESGYWTVAVYEAVRRPHGEAGQSSDA
jgi:Holliday junction resolvase RusA-like endonuclease